MNRTRQSRWLQVWVSGCALGVASLAGAANVTDVEVVPHLNDKGREAYARFLKADSARAFAVAENGAFGSVARRGGRPQATSGALYSCNKAARNVCRVYAVNDDVVYARYAAFDEKSQAILKRLVSEKFFFAEYGDEGRDYGVRSPEALRRDEYHADTPLALKGVSTILTPALVKMMVSPSAPIVIDALDGDAHKTLPGAYWIRGAGVAGGGDEARAEVQDRLGYILAGLTKGDTSAPLVFFCLESRCWLSYNAALRARELGYSNVHWYRGGTKAWQAAKLDTVESVQHGQVR